MRLVVLIFLIFVAQISNCQELKSNKGGLWKGELTFFGEIYDIHGFL